MVDRPVVSSTVAPLPSHARPLQAHDAVVSRTQARAPEWVGHSPPLTQTVATLRRFAPSRAPVLLLGESGTGKELAAAELHAQSGRQGPLVALNCGALSEALAASQLFGHARGAFTGAVGQHRGVFARADQGTVFLDEVGELPLPTQAMLLRVLETGRVCPVGAELEVATKARVVCATHRDLRGMVLEGTFRADLYHRLSVLTVQMPPLRERPDDVEALLEHFAQVYRRDVGHRIVFTEDARAAARQAAWTGNVRELRNAVHRAGMLAQGRPIAASDLLPEGGQMETSVITIPRGTFVSMRKALVQAVVKCEGSQRRAAAVLQLPRSTLGNWLRPS